MSDDLTFLSLCGMLGYGYPRDSLERGLARRPAFIGVDAGSTDPGPYYLGAGKAFVKDLQVERDIEPALVAARSRGIPLIIGTAGGSGARPHVDHFVETLTGIARRNDLHMTLAVIYADVEPGMVIDGLEAGNVQPCGPVPPLTPERVTASQNLVAQMGTAPIIEALQAEADVVIAGRCCDTAIFAAMPILRGFDPGLALHCAKIAECGALCAQPAGTNDALIATLHRDHFVVEPANPERQCTPESVAAHSLYEQPSPLAFVEPEGTVDMAGSRFEQIDGSAVRVSGTRLVPPETHTVKLEGAALAGYRAVAIAGVWDPRVLEHLDIMLESVQKTVAQHLRGIVEEEEYSLRFLRYGRGTAAPPRGPARPFSETAEAGLVVDAVAPNQELADTIVSLARATALHQAFPGRKATAGNLAFPFSPSDLQGGPVYEFSVYHLLEVDDERALFPVTYVDV